MCMWLCVYVEVCVRRWREFDVSSTVTLVSVYINLHFFTFLYFLSRLFCYKCQSFCGWVWIAASAFNVSSYMWKVSSPPLSLIAGSSLPSPPPPTPAGQDERSELEQRGGGLLHPDRRPGPGHARGTGGILLQVQDRVAPNEGVHCTSRCCLSCSGLSLLSLRQWC